MSAADDIALPRWALNEGARTLLEQVIAERPDWFLRCYDGSRINGETVFKGKAAGRLRRMHSDWLDRELAALDAQYHVTGIWDDEVSKALFHTEDGNRLIDRVLRETEERAVVPFTRMSIDLTEDGGRIAA
jgi:hypothetical protein